MLAAEALEPPAPSGAILPKPPIINPDRQRSS
jgi:hypothetical protein